MWQPASRYAGRRDGAGRVVPTGNGRWTTAAAAVLVALLLVAGGLPREAAAANRQVSPEPGTPAVGPAPGGARHVACLVPDAGDRAPLTDGTEAGRSVAAATGTEPDPATLALQADLDLLIHALAACLSTGQQQTVAQLATGRYLGVLAGTGGLLTPETYVALAQDLPTVPVTIREVGDVQLVEDDEASADVVYVVANQLLHGRWTFVRVRQPDEPQDQDTEDALDAPGAEATPPIVAATGSAGSAVATPEAVAARWQIDGETPLPVALPPGATRLEVELDEYEIDLARTRVDETAPVVVLAARNRGERDHEVLVLRLEGGAEPEALLQQPGPRLPEGFAFAGQVTVPAGGTAELILVDLAPGRYALVSLLPDENGVPDLAQGMATELRVG